MRPDSAVADFEQAFHVTLMTSLPYVVVVYAYARLVCVATVDPPERLWFNLFRRSWRVSVVPDRPSATGDVPTRRCLSARAAARFVEGEVGK